jgi:hypothetical protein
VLVHGLWGSPSDWDTFQPLISDSRLFIKRAGYDFPLAGTISASTPVYPAAVLEEASRSALGFAFNAPLVLAHIELTLADFRLNKNVATVQVDVAAHSMGGTVTRTAHKLPGFAGTPTYGMGFINKLITIGTPHLGSPLATQLLADNNARIRGILAKFAKKISIDTASIGGIPVTGGVGDLRGTGSGAGLSAALASLAVSNGNTVPTALIAGLVNPTNLNGLDCSFCLAILYA